MPGSCGSGLSVGNGEGVGMNKGYKGWKRNRGISKEGARVRLVMRQVGDVMAETEVSKAGHGMG